MRTGAAEKILTCVFEISGAWPLSGLAVQLFVIQTEIEAIRSDIGSRTYHIHRKASSMHTLSSSTQDEFTNFLGKTERHYNEDKSATQNAEDGLTAKLQNWLPGEGSLFDSNVRGLTRLMPGPFPTLSWPYTPSEVCEETNDLTTRPFGGVSMT
ncbi:hypothetical protein Tco_0361044 [Tanacetum coccineum]